jgi:hypothetical protein
VRRAADKKRFMGLKSQLDKRTVKHSTMRDSLETISAVTKEEVAKKEVLTETIAKELPAEVEEEAPTDLKNEDSLANKKCPKRREEPSFKEEEPLVKKTEVKNFEGPKVELTEEVAKEKGSSPTVEDFRTASPGDRDGSPSRTEPQKTRFNSYKRRDLATAKPDGFMSVQDLINKSNSATNSPRPDKKSGMDRGGPQSARGMSRQPSGQSRYLSWVC